MVTHGIKKTASKNVSLIFVEADVVVNRVVCVGAVLCGVAFVPVSVFVCSVLFTELVTTVCVVVVGIES